MGIVLKTSILILAVLSAGGLLAVSITQANFPGSMFAERLLAERQTSFLFQDELPIPPRIVVPPGQTEVTITSSQISWQYHSSFPASPALGYNGTTPGPTIEVESGQFVRVHWKNELPAQHIFAAPLGQMTCAGPPVRGVTHLHGAEVSEPNVTDKTRNSDGWPDLWTAPGEEQIAEYPNQQSARTLWYHDHAVGDTGRNVAAGLVGLYLIHDDYERSLQLPSGAFDIPLLFQSQGMNGDGTRYYTKDIAKEFYGNAAAVNGKLYPYVNVEPRKYRFRFVNGSNARSYAFKVWKEADHTSGPPIYQIGSDGGFLAHTVVLNDPNTPNSPRLLLLPGERADVILDFSSYAGQKLALHNSNLDPGDGEIPLDLTMEFRVGTALTAADTSRVPSEMREIPRIPPSSAVATRKIVLGHRDLPGGGQMLTLNGAQWSDPVTEKPKLGTTEIWEIVNTEIDRHPFHVHLVNFQVLDRRPFDVSGFLKNGELTYTDSAQAPADNELGWKDVVRVEPGMVTRIIATFGPYIGHYIYHCHILEHEDMDMMRPFEVVP